MHTQGRLTPSQQRLWFLQRYNPGDPAYNVHNSQRLTGRLDVPALQRALEEVVRRHGPLRSRFREVDGVPRQEILDAVRVPFTEVDLRGATGARQRLAELVADWDDRPFDLSEAPLIRAGLARVGDDEHLFRVCINHLAADGLSLIVLRTELAALYTAYSAGLPSPLPPLPTPDETAKSAGETAKDAGETAKDDETYWSGRLAGAPDLALPTDRPRGERPAGTGTIGAVARLTVPSELAGAVARLARSQRCTPFMVWLSAYQALLCRYTGQDDICVGTPFAGRETSGDEDRIGYFTKTIVLRGDLSGDPAFAALLRRTRDAAIGAYEHPDLPFERLRTGPPTGRNPLYQTWFNMHGQTAGGPPAQWGPDLLATHPGPLPRDAGDLELAPLDRGYDLTFDVWPLGDTLDLAVTYDRQLFDHATVTDLLQRYLLLVETLVAAPDRRLSTLPLLAAGEAGSVLDERACGTGDPATVIDLFLEQCRRTPDAPAVAFGDGTCTYADLDARSAAVAGAVRAVSAAGVVAIHLDRSPDLVAAVLGTLRAGAAYLPLDPAHPDARIDLMLADSGATAVLTDAAGAPRFDAAAGVPVVRVDQLPAAGTAALPVPQSGDLAYVIYTSGSTGTPKGVAVEHGSLADRVRWMRRAYRLGPADRVLQFASLSFDTHAEELFPVLAAGGTLVLPTVPSERLPDWLSGPHGRGLTVLDLPTAYWHRLVHDLRRDAWPPLLRLVIIGGSQADAAAVRAWHDTVTGVELVNTYGPTEATIVATAATLTPDTAGGLPPIGHPVGGTAAYVLGADGGPVPVGMPGELYLAGAGVARGYLGRPELTAQRFLADPYGPPGARMFRTGDRVRLRRDGHLEYLGRLDRQLKVRGYRIEPGEIEAALTACTGVAQAVVTVHEVLDGTQLVAYVEGVPGADPVVANLRAHLARTLPAYLVPNVIVVLDRLPLTTSGKPDLAALPAPDVAAPAGHEFVAPRTDAEDLVADIWAEVLGRERVGALDDFFDLGGHSLLATRFLARLRAATDVELPLRVLFTTPTVAGVAEEVERLMMADIEQLSDDELTLLLAAEQGRA